MADQAIIDRLNSAITRGREVLATRKTHRDGGSKAVDGTMFMAWQAQGLTALSSIFGPNHSLTTTFVTVIGQNGVPLAYSGYVEDGLGILIAAKDDIENGWTWTLKERIHEEVFDDFLQMASFLIDEHRLKAPAAVLAGGVLEEHVRVLSRKHGLPDAGKVSTMNDALKQHGVYATLTWRSVQQLYDIRSAAAHMKNDDYTLEDVVQMIDRIRLFMSQHPA